MTPVPWVEGLVVLALLYLLVTAWTKQLKLAFYRWGGWMLSWQFLLGVIIGGILGSWPSVWADRPRRPPAKVADEILGAAVRGLVVEHQTNGGSIRLRCTSDGARSRNLHRIASGLEPRGVYLNPVEYSEATPGRQRAHDENLWNHPAPPAAMDRLTADTPAGLGLQFDLRLDERRVHVHSATEVHAEIAAFLSRPRPPRSGRVRRVELAGANL